jgi:hypothetical protein
VQRSGLNSFGSGESPIADSVNTVMNELTVSQNEEEFLHHLRDYQLLKDSAMWSYYSNHLYFCSGSFQSL